MPPPLRVLHPQQASRLRCFWKESTVLEFRSKEGMAMDFSLKKTKQNNACVAISHHQIYKNMMAYRNATVNDRKRQLKEG
jgi:hypothetical protein